MYFPMSDNPEKGTDDSARLSKKEVEELTKHPPLVKKPPTRMELPREPATEEAASAIEGGESEI
jgi:hypothetical protein